MRVLAEPVFSVSFHPSFSFLRPFIYIIKLDFARPFSLWAPLGGKRCRHGHRCPRYIQQLQHKPGSNAPSSLGGAFGTRRGRCPDAGWVVSSALALRFYVLSGKLLGLWYGATMKSFRDHRLYRFGMFLLLIPSIFFVLFFSFSFLPLTYLRSGITKHDLLPPPHCGTRVHFHPEKTSAICSLVDSHRIAPT